VFISDIFKINFKNSKLPTLVPAHEEKYSKFAVHPYLMHGS
jgi:hypothetical protein